jgi:uncharacterized membrane protein
MLSPGSGVKGLLAMGWVARVFGVRPRITAAIVAGLVVGAAATGLAQQLKLSTDLILGWDTFCLTFVGAMLMGMARYGPAEIRIRAARDDEGRGAILALILLGAVASVVAVAAELSLAKGADGLGRALHVALAFITVAASWTMIQTIFAVHYAHEYYDADEARSGQDSEGLAFPGGEAPDYWDFLHFSFVIGVACQTADVAFTSKPLRRLGTVHSLIAFAFNTVIVALTINLLAGLF